MIKIIAILIIMALAVEAGDGFIQSEPKRFVMLDNGMVYLWED